MFRFQTFAAVLIGTGLASASAFSVPDSKGQRNSSAPAQTDPKAADMYLLRADFVPGARNDDPASPTGSPGPSVFQPGQGSSSLGTCVCVGSPPEGEANCGLPDTFNGGCNITPQQYSNLPFPGSVCGTSAWNGTTRDTDWYRFTLTATTNVRWRVNAEYPVVAFILTGNCPASVLGTANGPACTNVDVFAASLPPGTYVAWEGPDFSGPVINCGVSDDYKGTLSVFSCTTPANDFCSSATAISGNGPWFGTNVCSATDGPSPCGLLSNDVWYNWTSNVTGTVTFNTCNPGTTYDTVLSVYDGSGCTGTQLGCNDDIPCAPALRSGLPIAVGNGNVYKVQVGGFSGATGNFQLNVEPPCTTPVNDNCASATAIAGPGPFFGTNVCATLDGPLPSCTANMNRDVWYNWTANTTGVVNFTLCNAGTNYDSVLVVFDGLACTGTELGCDDDGCGPVGGPSRVSASVISGNPYKIQIGGWNGSTGNFQLQMIAAAPGVTFCEPGLAGVIVCPCGNPPSGPGRGCNNSSGTGGATMTDTGLASLAADTVVFTTTDERPTALTIVLQGDATIPAGVPYGDGIRCVGGTLKRLYVKTAVGGSITAPGVGDPTVSARSAALGDPISAGTQRYYMVYYRDPLIFACPPSPGTATFNSSSARSILWAL